LAEAENLYLPAVTDEFQRNSTEKNEVLFQAKADPYVLTNYEKESTLRALQSVNKMKLDSCKGKNKKQKNKKTKKKSLIFVM
jgi:hypothetical protein